MMDILELCRCFFKLSFTVCLQLVCVVRNVKFSSEINYQALGKSGTVTM